MKWKQRPDGTPQIGVIDDPFVGISLREIESDARRFHGEAPGLKSLLDVEVLIKGAKLAKDSNFRNDISISEVERRLLEEEEKSNWRGLREVIQQFGEGMRVTIMATACAAAALGWQQSAINTSTRTWPAQFGLAGDSWKVATINAIPSLSGSFIGTWVSDPLQGFSLQRDHSTPDNARCEANGLDTHGVRQSRFHLGRRFALMLSGVVSVACCIWSARCKSWQELLVCRVILGIAFGTKASVAPIFAAEAAMEMSRGRILMLWQMFDAFGIMLGFVVALIAPVSWEVQLGLALIPSLAQILVVLLCPESPRLLIRNKRYGEAYKSLRRLRRLELQAARDLYFIHFQLRQEVRLYDLEQEIGSSSFPYQDYVEKIDSFKRMLYLFTIPRNRRACLVAFLVMTSQQLCGINVLAYYSSIVFGNAASTNKIDLLSFGFGASNFVFTLLAFVLIDSKGRRFTLLTSFFFMTFTLLGASFCFNIEPEGSRVAAVVVTFILLYTASYSIGAGPVPFTLSAEIFPLAFREVGMSFSVMVNFLGLGLLVLFVPRITRSWSPTENERVGQRNVLLLFTGLNAIMLFLLFLMIPSTERKALEEMNQLFTEPTKGRVAANTRSIVNVFRPRDEDNTAAPDIALRQVQINELQQAEEGGQA